MNRALVRPRRLRRENREALYENRLKRRKSEGQENDKSGAGASDCQKLFVVENEGTDDGYKIISKKNMEDVDLLVNIHNSIVNNLS